MTDKPELKPCPFCGDDNSLMVEHHKGTILRPSHRIVCDNCGASSRYTDRDYIAIWNTRPAPEARAKDALQAIADLPPVAKRKWDDELNADLNLRSAEVNGQETAYRAVEALFDKPPRIECKQPTPPDRKALIGIAQATIEKTIAFDPANTGTWDCAEAVINALLPHLTNPEPQGFDEWFNAHVKEPLGCPSVVWKHHTNCLNDAYNAGYAAANLKAKALEWVEAPIGWFRCCNNSNYTIEQGWASDSYTFKTTLNNGTVIYDGDCLGKAKAAAQAHFQALYDSMGVK